MTMYTCCSLLGLGVEADLVVKVLQLILLPEMMRECSRILSSFITHKLMRCQ